VWVIVGVVVVLWVDGGFIVEVWVGLINMGLVFVCV